ncbi:hypothetical protein EJ05DRAFT_502642 [Pseudovirgaria hyperparasitica]|uniref:Uncharacterized protein n=1 Tax=Pseudovirgaria hyperparasitica TaxID=470096 RepID=A0A6A6W2A5_9PEZI|nr:uncharacterized protein EJ05DRAFT_502642 [Pseudovirgaria hyperparasitica]KAF2756176.1 hypothetical protein EJ05DRAFT_502642 [Pseudovirgaria hyperparasitica]
MASLRKSVLQNITVETFYASSRVHLQQNLRSSLLPAILAYTKDLIPQDFASEYPWDVLLPDDGRITTLICLARDMTLCEVDSICNGFDPDINGNLTSQSGFNGHPPYKLDPKSYEIWSGVNERPLLEDRSIFIIVYHSSTGTHTEAYYMKPEFYILLGYGRHEKSLFQDLVEKRLIRQFQLPILQLLGVTDTAHLFLSDLESFEKYVDGTPPIHADAVDDISRRVEAYYAAMAKKEWADWEARRATRRIPGIAATSTTSTERKTDPEASLQTPPPEQPHTHDYRLDTPHTPTRSCQAHLPDSACHPRIKTEEFNWCNEDKNQSVSVIDLWKFPPPYGDECTT